MTTTRKRIRKPVYRYTVLGCPPGRSGGLSNRHFSDGDLAAATAWSDRCRDENGYGYYVRDEWARPTPAVVHTSQRHCPDELY